MTKTQHKFCKDYIMKYIIFFSIILVVIFITGCIGSIPLDPIPKYTPKPLSLFITIPEWITTSEDISLWLKMLGAQYTSDEFTTGYNDYYFTPAELAMSEIPDVNNSEKTIKKRLFSGDCDDWAIVTAFLSHKILGLEAYFVSISTSDSAHALSYAVNNEKVYVYDLWYYIGEYPSIQDYVTKKYAGYRIRREIEIITFLEELFLKGHVQYYTP